MGGGAPWKAARNSMHGLTDGIYTICQSLHTPKRQIPGDTDGESSQSAQTVRLQVGGEECPIPELRCPSVNPYIVLT